MTAFQLIDDPAELVIATGTDWSATMRVYASDGATPLVLTNPVLEMRRDHTVGSQLLAHLDASGSADGLIQVDSNGVWTLSIASDVTAQMPYGRGFWDAFGNLGAGLVKVASGIVVLQPRVVAYPGSGAPVAPPAAQPVQTVAVEPAQINLLFPAGDDFHLDLTLAEDGVPANLTGASVAAVITTVGGSQQLATFTSSIAGNVIHLSLPGAVTATLPASCEWDARLTTPGQGTVTVAQGSVTVTR